MDDDWLLRRSAGHDSLVQLIQRAQRAGREHAQTSKRRRAPVASTSQLSAASFYVPELPAQPSDLTLSAMYSGHLPAAYSIQEQADLDSVENDAHLFFLLVKAKHVAQREKLVLWFNGGPGCSSFDGALLELGPVTVEGRGERARLVDNPGKWNEYANVLFIDQPAGTGYSYINKGKAVTELAPAADQLVTFLSNFYSIFPEYAKMDTYIAGESYAGTTIPYLAQAITSTTTLPTRLRGLLIGNGWFSPVQQYPAYVSYGRLKGFLDKDNAETRAVDKLMKQCDAALEGSEGKGHILVGTCEGLIDAVMKAGRTTIDTKEFCMGAYDVRPSKFCGEYPSGLQYATPYLGQQDVIDSFHASDKHEKWTQCNNTVGSQMWSPKSRPSVELLPDLLEKMDMLFFAGDQDLMCAWPGIEDTLTNMTWRGEQGFGNVTEEEWYVNGTLAGTWRSARNMTWVKVFDAGHMVPIDKPYAAHDLLLRFIGIETLSAAGDASRIPSRIGKATVAHDAVIGKIAPHGGTLPAVISQQEEQAAAAASSAAAAVDLAGLDGQPIDKDRELLYGPRRTAVLVCIIIAVALAIYSLLRWRAKQRRAKGWTPRRAPASAKSRISGSGGYRFKRLSGSTPGTPSRGPGPGYNDFWMSEVNLLQRIEEHEQEHGVYDEEERMQDVAKTVFALDDDEVSDEEKGRHAS